MSSMMKADSASEPGRDVRRAGSPSHYCMFIGYPASGHSVIGAFIDAHRNAIVSHELDAAWRIWHDRPGREQLFRDIRTKAAKQATIRRSPNHSGEAWHRYNFPTLCQGTAEELHVIGDKKGGGTARLAAQVGGEELVDRIRNCVKLPLRVLLVTRNPFDMVVSREGTVQDVVSDFLKLSLGTESFLRSTDQDEVHMVRHEQMVDSPRETMERLCTFLSLEPYTDFVDTCANAVFSKTTSPRLRRDWDHAEVDLVEQLIDFCPWLHGYDLEGAY